MLDFQFLCPTKIFFGRKSLHHLGGALSRLGSRVLFVYGQGSIKKTGLYDSVTDILMRHDIEYHELSGVQPNPRISQVRHGIDLCRKYDLDGLIAVGGGSVIDTAKTIATGVYQEGDPWELFLLGDTSVKKALPLGTVLTFAGTGSEMNGNAVISNEETAEKLAIHHDLLRPKFSILDPSLTFTMSPSQTAAGVVDIFSHILEQYFSPTKQAFLQDRMAEGLLQTCIRYGPLVLAQPKQYEARAQLMWTSSVALNGLLGCGRVSDWATHGIEHAVSALFDVTHGIGLAILIPSWMEHVLTEETRWKFVEYAQNVWQIHGADSSRVAQKGIEKTREFFVQLGMPTSLREVGVGAHDLEEIAEKTIQRGEIGKFKKLGKHDVLAVLKQAF